MPSVHVSEKTKEQLDRLKGMEEHRSFDAAIKTLLTSYGQNHHFECIYCEEAMPMVAGIEAGKCLNCGTEVKEWSMG